MKDDLESAKRYRQRADKLRDIAKGAADGERKTILDVATDYDDMARSREQVDRDDPSGGASK